MAKARLKILGDSGNEDTQYEVHGSGDCHQPQANYVGFDLVPYITVSE